MGSGWLPHPAYLTPGATPHPTPFRPRRMVRGTSRPRGGAPGFSPPVPAPSQSGGEEFPPRKGSGWLLRVPHLVLCGPTAGLEQQSRERPATPPPFPPTLGMTSWWGRGGQGEGTPHPPFSSSFPPLSAARGPGRPAPTGRLGGGCVCGRGCSAVLSPPREAAPPSARPRVCVSLCACPPRQSSPASLPPRGDGPGRSPLLRRRPTGPPGGRGEHWRGGSRRRGASSATNGAGGRRKPGARSPRCL